MTATAPPPPLSACCAVPVRTRPADPRSVVATSVTYCPSCARALTMTPHPIRVREIPAEAPPGGGCSCDAIDGDHDRPGCAIYVSVA